MPFECSNCGATVLDDTAAQKGSGGICSNCGEDPGREFTPYPPELEARGRELSAELHARLASENPAEQEAALYFLEGLILGDRGHAVTLKVLRKPAMEGKCGACSSEIVRGDGLRIELRDRWRGTMIEAGLCEQHLASGWWEGDINLHRSQSWPWLGVA